jgi:hypothetical protein
VSRLHLGWASHAATRRACESWHYSGTLPTGKLVKVGVWEDDVFKGVVIFSRGASPFLLRRYDLDQIEGCELTRVALRDHDAPVSRIVAIALRMLKRQSPGLRLVVSFADPEHDHHGGIYQAGNWIYTGASGETIEYLVDGDWKHVKSMYEPRGFAIAAGRDADWAHKRGVYNRLKESGELEHTPTRVAPGKFRYLYPLDREMRELVELNRLPYPKRTVESPAS